MPFSVPVQNRSTPVTEELAYVHVALLWGVVTTHRALVLAAAPSRVPYVMLSPPPTAPKFFPVMVTLPHWTLSAVGAMLVMSGPPYVVFCILYFVLGVDGGRRRAREPSDAHAPREAATGARRGQAVQLRVTRDAAVHRRVGAVGRDDGRAKVCADDAHCDAVLPAVLIAAAPDTVKITGREYAAPDTTV